MNAGIVLSYLNQSYFSDRLSTLCEFIPQVWTIARLSRF
jgi:V-type H+-transporting ATPase subunit a